jgi:hypothetical protein
MVLLHLSDSSPCGLARLTSLHYTYPPSLCPLSRTSSLLRGIPSLHVASVLSPSWFRPLVTSNAKEPSVAGSFAHGTPRRSTSTQTA